VDGGRIELLSLLVARLSNKHGMLAGPRRQKCEVLELAHVHACGEYVRCSGNYALHNTTQRGSLESESEGLLAPEGENRLSRTSSVFGYGGGVLLGVREFCICGEEN
jgi:hypothetical protein